MTFKGFNYIKKYFVRGEIAWLTYNLLQIDMNGFKAKGKLSSLEDFQFISGSTSSS